MTKEEHLSLPCYHLDLNTLYRVCQKICKTKKGSKILFDAIQTAWLQAPGRKCYGVLDWFACLTVKEFFPIVGEATDKMKES